jgi:uncharacterized membrane protein
MNTRSIAYISLFIALGVVMPQGFHLVGLGGAFLPMHIPVLLAGLILGPAAGAVTGFFSPLLSSLLTGMPPVMPPIAPIMCIELSIMGLVAGYMSRIEKINPVLKIIPAWIAGRAVYTLLVFCLGSYLLKPEQSPQAYMLAVIIAGLPGYCLQIVLIPALLYIFDRAGLRETLGRVPQKM